LRAPFLFIVHQSVNRNIKPSIVRSGKFDEMVQKTDEIDLR
jgi:hypothetical protein